MMARLPCGCWIPADVQDSAYSDYQLVCKHGTVWGFVIARQSVENPQETTITWVPPPSQGGTSTIS